MSFWILEIAGQRMNLMIAMHALNLGGIARIAIDLARAWSEQGHAVTLVTEYDQSADSYRLGPGIERVILKRRATRGILEKLERMLAYRREIQRRAPHVLLAMGPTCGSLVAVSALGLPCRKVICEFGVPWLHPLGGAREWLRRISYGLVDAGASEHPVVANWFKRHSLARRSVCISKSVRWPLPASGDPSHRS